MTAARLGMKYAQMYYVPQASTNWLEPTKGWYVLVENGDTIERFCFETYQDVRKVVTGDAGVSRGADAFPDAAHRQRLCFRPSDVELSGIANALL